jgi:hypothetical protein
MVLVIEPIVRGLEIEVPTDFGNRTLEAKDRSWLGEFRAVLFAFPHGSHDD